MLSIGGLADLRKDGTNVCNTGSGYPRTTGNQLLGAEEEAQLCRETQVTSFQLCNLQMLMIAFVDQERTVKDLPSKNPFGNYSEVYAEITKDTPQE